MTGRAESALLAAVERSPEAAAAHDRAGWVGLFTVDGRIEDPVGSRPHVGQAITTGPRLRSSSDFSNS